MHGVVKGGRMKGRRMKRKIRMNQRLNMLFVDSVLARGGRLFFG